MIQGPKSKLTLSILLILSINAFGVVGYMIIEGWSFSDSLFMTLITLTTVGYEEVNELTRSGEIFTMILLIVGVGIIFYLLGSQAKLLLEGQLQDIIGRSRLQKKIRNLKKHYIVCGFGRMGKTVANELKAKGVDVLVIEKEPVPTIDKGDFIFLEGDANDEDLLETAGVERAKAIISVLPTDAKNLFLVLSARELNPDIFIVARANQQNSERKMRRAGANRVVSPYHAGAVRIVNSILRPAVMDFLEFAHSESLGIELKEIIVLTGSKLIDSTLQAAAIDKKLGIIILAIQKPDGAMVFNPTSQSKMQNEDKLIAIGRSAKLNELESIASGA